MNAQTPRYSVWDCIMASLALSQRAIEEVRALSRQPGPKGDRGQEGKEGPIGKDGAIGLGVDEFDVLYDGERTFTFRWAKGDHIEERKCRVSVVLDRGVYKSDANYLKGDAVTFGGSIWIAQEDTKAKPETGPEWRLAVKRGRDGKDGGKGEKGEQGIQGKAGRDLTQLGPDGGKW